MGVLITDCPRWYHPQTNVSQKLGNNGHQLLLKTTSQFLRDLPQEHQVNTPEFSFDLHFPNITQQQINTPLVVHNDHTLKEFIQGEERCLKFINQDLTFLQESHILSTFTNVSHTTTSLKELTHINLPTCTSNEHSSIENTASSCTQSVKPALGFTLAKVHQAESNPTLTAPQLLEIEPCREYTETPL